MASSPDIATLSIDDFAPHLNAIFEMGSPGGMVPLRLAALCHGDRQCGCHISAIRNQATARVTRERRSIGRCRRFGQRDIASDRHPVRLDRWTAEPGRTLDRSMASLPPDKGDADR